MQLTNNAQPIKAGSSKMSFPSPNCLPSHRSNRYSAVLLSSTSLRSAVVDQGISRRPNLYVSPTTFPPRMHQFNFAFFHRAKIPPSFSLSPCNVVTKARSSISSSHFTLVLLTTSLQVPGDKLDTMGRSLPKQRHCQPLEQKSV